MNSSIWAFHLINNCTFIGFLFKSLVCKLNTKFNGGVYFMKDRQDEYPNGSIYGKGNQKVF